MSPEDAAILGVWICLEMGLHAFLATLQAVTTWKGIQPQQSRTPTTKDHKK